MHLYRDSLQNFLVKFVADDSVINKFSLTISRMDSLKAFSVFF